MIQSSKPRFDKRQLSKIWLIYFFHIAMKDEATCVDLSREYNLLVTGSEGAKVGIWNLQDGNKIGELVGHSQGLTGVRVIPKVGFI